MKILMSFHGVSLIWSLFCGMAMANGGGYRYGLQSTGALAPVSMEGTEQVAIVEEDLNIDLWSQRAAVTVNYKLLNTTNRAVKVVFGFPYEETKSNGGWPVPASAQSGNGLTGYKVESAGKPIKSLEQNQPWGENGAPGTGGDVLKGIGGWMISELAFKAGEQKELRISYFARHEGGNVFVSETGSQSESVFRYRLSTGAVWHGPIRKGKVCITARSVEADEVSIGRPVDKFKRDGVSWVWEFADLEPTLADDIVVAVMPALEYHGKYFQRKERWMKTLEGSRVSASSVLKPEGRYAYDAEAVLDGEPKKDGMTRDAWCEGVEGAGIGEWIELRPAEPMRLAYVDVVPGYVDKDPREMLSKFTSNSRPAKMEMIVNGSYKRMIEFEDWPAARTISLDGYSKPVSSIRFIIREVYPGTRYQDTCISSINAYEKLARKPQLQQQR